MIITIKWLNEDVESFKLQMKELMSADIDDTYEKVLKEEMEWMRKAFE